jgi:hypothetical protein
MSKATRRRILLVLLILGAIGIGSVLAVRTLRSRFDAWFEAADYPALFAEGGWSRYGLPSTLPLAATNVAIYAPAAAPALLAAPDQYVEVRFMLPPAQAAALLTTSQLSAATVPNGSYASMLDSLSTPDDRDSSTPLPPGFQHIFLKNPSGMNVGGVSINPARGEMVYWIFEF